MSKYRYQCVIPGIDIGFDSDIDFGIFFDEHNNLSLTRVAVESATAGGNPLALAAKVAAYQTEPGKETIDFAYKHRHDVLGVAGVFSKHVAAVDIALNELEAIEDVVYAVWEGDTVLVDGEERTVANSELVGSAADHTVDAGIGLITLGYGAALEKAAGNKVVLQAINYFVGGGIAGGLSGYANGLDMTGQESLTKQYFKNRPRAPYRIEGAYEDDQGRIWTSQEKHLVADGYGYFDENGNYVALTGQQSVDPNAPPPVTPEGPTVMGPYSSEHDLGEAPPGETKEELEAMKTKAQEDRKQAEADKKEAEERKARAESKEKKAKSKVDAAKKKTDAAEKKRDKAEQRVEKYKKAKESYDAMIKEVKQQLLTASINGDKKTERDAKKILEDLEAKRKEYERKETVAREDARRAQKEYDAALGELESAYLEEDLSKAVGDSADRKKNKAEQTIKHANATEEYANYGLDHPMW